jgi:formylglycine-generating enzyme required for sulfatase activity
LIEQQGKPGDAARHKRRLLIAGGALVTTMVVAYLIGSYQITPEPQTQPTLPPPAQLDTYSFQTVTVDRNGREISRETKRARYFTVELGAGVTLEMVEIPGGSFMMGSPPTEANRGSDEGPRHLVNVGSFFMGNLKVTQKQWMALMGSNPSYFIGDDNPVDNVSWNDAQEFLAALNRRLGLQDKDRRYQYRLPSEAEWEYAARAGTDTPFAFGERIPPQIADYNSLAIANAFGLFNMHSHPEWCEDVYHKDYNGAPTDGSAWLSGGVSSLRVLRGGSNGASARYWRSAVRHSSEPDGRYVNQWFRVVVSARIS